MFDRCEVSFIKLKALQTLVPILALVESERFTIYYDILGVGLGYVLM